MRTRIANFSRATFSSLVQRNFRLYFVGQIISLTGGWMQNVAQSWLVLHLTGSGVALGVVASLQYGPSLFLSPFAGLLADRLPKRRILFATQTTEGLLAIALGTAIATGSVRVWMVYVMAGVLGVVNSIDYPTRQSFLYELAGPRELLSAVGLTGTANNLARVIGPAIAGAFIAVTGLATCFFVNGISFVAVLVCLAMMRPAEFHHTRRAQTEGGLAEVFAYVRRAPVVREALLMMAVIGVLTFEFSTTLPMITKFTFKSGADGLGWMMAAMGVGAAMGGLFTAGRRDEGLDKLAIAALGFGVFTGLVGAAPSAEWATVAMGFVGVFSARFVGLCNGLLQLQSAPQMRNRVMALWGTAFLGSTVFGAPLLGWLGGVAGPRWPLGMGALGGVVAAGIGLAGYRRVREREAAEAAMLPDQVLVGAPTAAQSRAS